MKQFLFWVAVLGWTLGLTVHILSLAGIDVTELIPFVWILHIGIFVVWIPAILALKKNEDLVRFQKSRLLTRMNTFGFLKIIFKNVPRWLIVIAIVGSFYAFINFVLFVATQHGVPDIQNGQYVLQSHGTLIKTLSEQEYHHFKANEVRGFSGHWIAFYGIAMAVLFPFKLQTEKMIP
jgi:hypothetical protein